MAENNLILIVDDEENFREIFKARLAAAGYRIETAVNGEEGIAKAKALLPDLVLMDVKMPVMDGINAVLVLHNDPSTAALKIAFLTSFGDPVAEMEEIDRQYAQEFGAVDYIKKTDDASTIVEKVKGILK